MTSKRSKKALKKANKRKTKQTTKRVKFAPVFNAVTENPYNRDLPDGLKSLLNSIDSAKQKRGLQQKINDLKLQQKNEEVLAKYIQGRLDDGLLNAEALSPEQEKLLAEFKDKTKKKLDPNVGLEGINETINNFLDTQLLRTEKKDIEKRQRQRQKASAQQMAGKTQASGSITPPPPTGGQTMGSTARQLRYTPPPKPSLSPTLKSSMSPPQYAKELKRISDIHKASQIRSEETRIPVNPDSLRAFSSSSTMRQLSEGMRDDDDLLDVASTSRSIPPSVSSQRSKASSIDSQEWRKRDAEMARIAKDEKRIEKIREEEDKKRLKEIEKEEKEKLKRMEELRITNSINASGLFFKTVDGKYKPTEKGIKQGIQNRAVKAETAFAKLKK